MSSTTDGEAELDQLIAGFLARRVGDDEWILQDLILFLETEHATLWHRCRARLGEQDENGWAAALLARLTELEARLRFRL
jgi:hypothetical protein